MSELGFVYFLGRAEARKAVAVYFVSLAVSEGVEDSYIESVGICWSASCFDASHYSGK